MKTMNKEEFAAEDVFGVGAPNDAFAKYFKGNSYLKPLTEAGVCPVFLANVTFEPGCRNNWHIHHAKSGGSQLLICTAGEGWYQEENKPAVSLTPGYRYYYSSRGEALARSKKGQLVLSYRSGSTRGGNLH